MSTVCVNVCACALNSIKPMQQFIIFFCPFDIATWCTVWYSKCAVFYRWLHVSSPPPPPTHQTSSDLSSLVGILCATFSDKCPVYKAPTRHPPQHSLSQPSYPGYPHEAGYQPKPGYVLLPSQYTYEGMPASQTVSPPSTGSYHYGYEPTDSVGPCPSPFPQTSECCVVFCPVTLPCAALK